MFTAFERMVGLRYLRARRQEGFISVISWFSLLGIGLGVATLIIVMSVMNGFREELFSRILGMNGHIYVFSQSGAVTDYEGLAARLRAVPGVISVGPSIEGQALLSQGGAATGLLVRGIDAAGFRARLNKPEQVVAGSLDDFADDQIAIGRRLAERYHVNVGDTLTLISPVSKPSAFGSLPRMRAYRIALVYDVGMFEYDNNFVFMPLAAAQTFYRLGDAVESVEVFLTNPQAAASLRSDIGTAAGEGMRILDWQNKHASFVNALAVERNVMFLILTLIILVAAFNIISGMIMLVKDKGRDIAILRTMGATRGMVMRIFFLTGASVGVAGTMFGAVLGIAFATNIERIRQFLQSLSGTELFSAEIYYLSQLPAIIQWHEVAQVVLMALALSFLATLYPSWRAARLDPVEALRYE